MSTRTVQVTCPSCEYTFPLDVPRHNAKGTGTYYASEIKKLSRHHLLVMTVLEQAGAFDFEHGLILNEVWLRSRDKCLSENQHVPSKMGVGGRLSELQGLHIVSSKPNLVKLIDRDSMVFRAERRARWFLTKAS